MNDHSEFAPGQEPVVFYSGRSVLLRAISRQDYPALLRWRADPSELHGWSSPRPVPTVEEFAQETERFLAQSITLLAVDRQTNHPAGFVQAHNINSKDGWCFIRAYYEPPYRGRDLAHECSLVFLDFIFRRFSFRKVYIDTWDLGAMSLGSVIETACVEEARLREHSWHDGRYLDLIRLALYREGWPDLSERARMVLNLTVEASAMLAEQGGEAAAPSTVD